MPRRDLRVFVSWCGTIGTDIIRTHGMRGLLFWWLRILKAFIDYQIKINASRIKVSRSSGSQVLLMHAYLRILSQIKLVLEFFLRKHFDNDFF